MSDPRSVDCEVWAKRQIRRLTGKMSVHLLEIRPKAPYRVLSGIRLPTGRMFWPQPPWHYHVAVYAGGLVRDEIYPDGIPIGQYRNNFEHQDAIDFTPRNP